jgi:hypothetical protein
MIGKPGTILSQGVSANRTLSIYIICSYVAFIIAVIIAFFEILIAIEDSSNCTLQTYTDSKLM